MSRRNGAPLLKRRARREQEDILEGDDIQTQFSQTQSSPVASLDDIEESPTQKNQPRCQKRKLPMTNVADGENKKAKRNDVADDDREEDQGNTMNTKTMTTKTMKTRQRM
jgi:hypothetical protein